MTVFLDDLQDILSVFVHFTKLKPNNLERIISLIPFHFSQPFGNGMVPRKQDMRREERGLCPPRHLPVILHKQLPRAGGCRGACESQDAGAGMPDLCNCCTQSDYLLVNDCF